MAVKVPKRHSEIYRGHEIYVEREKSMAGDELLFYSVFRKSDQYECMSGFSYGDEWPSVFAKYLRERIDSELLEEHPWSEA